MSRPVALDLFSGAGGAAWGLYLAGFDVVGVDIKPQPRYPAFHKAEHAKHFKFHQADALTFPLDGFDFIWASPPCQAFTALRFMHDAKQHPNLIPDIRRRLMDSETPYAIENVEGAPLGESGSLIMLCGTMFGLQVPDGRAELRRHRLFETSFSIPLRPACSHSTGVLGIYGGHRRDRCRTTIQVIGDGIRNGGKSRIRESFSIEEARLAMGIDWMPMSSLSQAIPPAYSAFIGEQVMEYLKNG